MAGKHAQPKHFLREWRKFRELTLEQAAERAGTTHATLSRIERGKLPYNQALLEVLAEVYRADPASLIIRDPSDPAAIWSVWEKLKPAQRETALVMLEGLARTGTSG